MGQSRPVRVIHLVTRGSIEERVLKTLDRKRSLFAGVFDGESDEVSFEALGQQQFLQTVRELIDAPAEEPLAPAAPPPTDANAKLLAAGVQFLEALAEVLGRNGTDLPPELAQRAAAAVQRIQRGMELPNDP